jgi:hypothetical protein
MKKERGMPSQKIFSLCFTGGGGSVTVQTPPGSYNIQIFTSQGSPQVFNGTSTVNLPDANCRVVGWSGTPVDPPDFHQANFVATGYTVYVDGPLCARDPWPPT